jgi:hypothetical protein
MTRNGRRRQKAKPIRAIFTASRRIAEMEHQFQHSRKAMLIEFPDRSTALRAMDLCSSTFASGDDPLKLKTK